MVEEGGYAKGVDEREGVHTLPVVIENLTFPVNIFFFLTGNSNEDQRRVDPKRCVTRGIPLPRQGVNIFRDMKPPHKDWIALYMKEDERLKKKHHHSLINPPSQFPYLIYFPSFTSSIPIRAFPYTLPHLLFLTLFLFHFTSHKGPPPLRRHRHHRSFHISTQERGDSGTKQKRSLDYNERISFLELRENI